VPRDSRKPATSCRLAEGACVVHRQNVTLARSCSDRCGTGKARIGFAGVRARGLSSRPPGFYVALLRDAFARA